MKKRKNGESPIRRQNGNFFVSAAAFLSLFVPLAQIGGAPAAAAADEKAYAQGNLFVVYEALSGRTSDAYPQHTNNLSDLWCQATRDGETRVPIKSANFLQVLPRPARAHRAHVSAEHRAYLHFEDAATPKVAGKYKCEITTQDDEFVTGNLFVYLRPIFHTNSTLRLDQTDDDQPFHFTGPSVKVTRGETARLPCPAIGYPPPTVHWLRDSQPIETSNTAKYRQFSSGELHIFGVDDPDAGVYECLAQNAFPLRLDADEHIFSARIEQHLRVGNSMSWLVPLIIILVIFVLLFIIIYACAWWKRRQHAQYHVAKKEKCLRRAEDQNNTDEDVDED